MFEAEPGPVACPCGCLLVTWLNYDAVDWRLDDFGAAYNRPLTSAAPSATLAPGRG